MGLSLKRIQSQIIQLLDCSPNLYRYGYLTVLHLLHFLFNIAVEKRIFSLITPARTLSISWLKSRVLKSTFLTRQLFIIVFKSKILVKCTVLKQNAPLCFDALISLDRRSVGATYQLTLKLRYEFALQWSQALRNIHEQGDWSPPFFW